MIPILDNCDNASYPYCENKYQTDKNLIGCHVSDVLFLYDETDDNFQHYASTRVDEQDNNRSSYLLQMKLNFSLLRIANMTLLKYIKVCDTLQSICVMTKSLYNEAMCIKNILQ